MVQVMIKYLKYMRMKHEDNNGVKSDLVIVMKEKVDDRFKRRGFDLHIKEKIHLYDSLVGLKRTIDFIDKENYL